MRGFNQAIIMGNVARDPEIRYTASKQPVAKFAVAVNRKWKGQNGEIHEEVDFIPVSAWGPQAESCEKYVRKGSPVLVEGRIRISNYEKDGQKRTFTEIVARTVQFLGGGKSQDGEAFQPPKSEPVNTNKGGSFGSLRDGGFNGEEILDDFPGGDMEGDGVEADIPF